METVAHLLFITGTCMEKDTLPGTSKIQLSYPITRQLPGITEIFRHRMVLLILIMPVFINITLALSSFEEWRIIHALNIAILISPVLALVVVTMVISFTTGQGGSNVRIMDKQNTKIDAEPVKDTADDDKYWKGGVIYVNRDDGRIMVPKRFGVGSTFNMGNPVGLAIFAIIITIPAVIIISLLVLH
jgi:uncharacterized membrane protein